MFLFLGGGRGGCTGCDGGWLVVACLAIICITSTGACLFVLYSFFSTVNRFYGI